MALQKASSDICAGFGKSPGRTFGYLLFYAVFLREISCSGALRALYASGFKLFPRKLHLSSARCLASEHGRPPVDTSPHGNDRD